MDGTQPQNVPMHSVPVKDSATSVRISKPDYILLKAWQNIFKIPILAVVHRMIGQSVKCWNEKHDEYIVTLENRQRTQLRIILAYFNKYGPIHL